MSTLRTTASEPERIARSIGLSNSKAMTEITLARRVSTGFPVGTVTTLARHIDPKRRYIVESDIVPRTTLHTARKEKRNLSKDHSETVFLLGKVVTEADRIFQDRDKVSSFFMTPHPLLDGESPFSLAKSSVAGAEAVMNLLARTDAGVAV